MTAATHSHIKRALYYVEADGEQWEYWQSCVMNKPGCLSILARPSPRRAVALSKPCIVFLSCARARFLWRCRVKRWPPASCKSHGDGPATSPGASPPATEQPWRPHSVRLSVCFQVILDLTFLFSPLFSLFIFFFTLTSFTPLPSTSFSPSFNILFATSWLSFSSLCPHLLSSLHPFFPPPFVPLSRSEEGLSGFSWASHRSRPHLAKGISETAVSNKRTWTHTRGATVHT